MRDFRGFVPPSNFKYVRGKISRDRVIRSGVNIPKDIPLGDTRLLASLLYKPTTKEKVRDVGIIVHQKGEERSGRYLQLTQRLMPTRTVELMCLNDLQIQCQDLFEFIVGSKVVFSSSLTGLTFAHSFGVPAIVFLDSNGYEFMDYFSVYERIRYPQLSFGIGFEESLRTSNKRLVQKVNPTRNEVALVQASILNALPYQECFSDVGKALLKSVNGK